MRFYKKFLSALLISLLMASQMPVDFASAKTAPKKIVKKVTKKKVKPPIKKSVKKPVAVKPVPPKPVVKPVPVMLPPVVAPTVTDNTYASVYANTNSTGSSVYSSTVPTPAPVITPTSTPTPTVNTKEYVDSANGYKLSYPSNWIKFDLGVVNVMNTTGFAGTSSDGKSLVAMVMVLSGMKGADVTNNMFVDMFIERERSTTKSFAVISKNNSTFAGVPSLIIKAHVIGKDNSSHDWNQIVIVKDDRLYALVFMTPLNQLNTYLSEFDSFTKTFTLIK
ncbi:MAG: PsbP-related protein [Acidobacteriota bacterium]